MKRAALLLLQFVPLLIAPFLLAAADTPPPQATPLSDPASWIVSEDYPADALRKEVEGATAFRLDIDKVGVPTKCTIVTSSGSASLDDTTCAKVMERARFTPPRSAKGRPLPSSFERRVVWRVPGGDGGPMPIVPYSGSVTFFVEPDGSITGCEAVVNGKAMGNAGPCSAPFGGHPVQPMRDAKGKPIRQKIRMTSSLEKLDP